MGLASQRECSCVGGLPDVLAIQTKVHIYIAHRTFAMYEYVQNSLPCQYDDVYLSVAVLWK